MRDWQHALAGIVTLKPRAGVLVGLCPINAEKTPSFTVYPDGHYHCYGCGKHGWCDDLLGSKPLERASRLPERPKIWPELDWADFTRPEHQKAVAGRLSAWRGYPARFCEWLAKCGNVGLFEDQICFPIRQHGKIVRLHVRRSEKIDWKARGSQPFFYYPTIGAGSDAMVIRLGERFGVAHIFESQWDLFAVMSTRREQGLYIATRGSCSARKLEGIRWPPVARVWTQNDESSELWLKSVVSILPRGCEMTVIQPPANCKDANDMLRAGVL